MKRVAARLFVRVVAEAEGGDAAVSLVVPSAAGADKPTALGSEQDDAADASSSADSDSERASAASSEDEMLTLQIGKTMDGQVGKMIRVLERLKASAEVEDLDLEVDAHEQRMDAEGDEAELSESSLEGKSLLNDASSLLRALILFRRVFPSQPPSPMSSSGTLTPTPSTPTASLLYSGHSRRKSPLLALGRVLAAPVFDQEAEIEDARDKVVDMLADIKRRRS